VQEIQDRVQEDGLIRISPQNLEPGTRISIQSGPFEGMMGRVERELDDRKRVAILLETILNARVLIERRWVEAVLALQSQPRHPLATRRNRQAGPARS
jgi:transcription antitermination factor NusG